MKSKLTVLKKSIDLISKKEGDYICLTDIAKYKDSQRSDDVIRNWLRNRNTLEFLEIWEKIHNKNFNPVELDGIKKNIGLNSFTITPKQWISQTNAIGIISKPGRYGGTYAHKNIAFEFASWISPKFKLYLIKEFERLKEKEVRVENLDWNIKRNLAKINYEIHTDAIRNNLIPPKVSVQQENKIYANEAELLNIALFGITSKKWKEKNKKETLRDSATPSQLICLSNLESLNSLLIKERLSQKDRLIKLNEVAISQMKILTKKQNIINLTK
jgi:hypothetical protein